MRSDLSPKQVAEILGVGERTVVVWLNKEIMRGYKAGPKLWRVKPEEVERFRMARYFPVSPSLARISEKCSKSSNKTQKDDKSDV